MFIPLTKADATQRLVYGSVDETPDRAREVMDYPTAKPAFQSWSDDLAKASGGKNLGNVRAQHNLTKAAGCLRAIEFDDAARRISFCAHIVDDQEWAKVEAGVYTGFSPGGSYAKSWPDPSLVGHKRYTPRVGELSIVDMPCIPSATFTMTKADGAEVVIEFILDKAYEPGNEATKDRAETMAKAAGTGTFKDHVIQARADLIVENAQAALAKMADPEEPADAPIPADTAIDPLASLNASLAKADEALRPDVVVVSGGAFSAYAAAIAGTLSKGDVVLAIAPPSPEAVALIGADFAKTFAAVQLIRDVAEPILAKGLYQIGDVACSLQSFGWITQDVIFEEMCEGDSGSKLPQQAVDILNALKAFMIAMVEEEVAEMLTRSANEAGDTITLTVESGDEMMLANQIVDLVKADEGRMAKAGARNSKGDAGRIQSIHDKACELGAGCDNAVAKAADLATDNDRLTKAVADVLPRIDGLVETITELRSATEVDRAQMAKMADQIAVLGGRPAPSKLQATLSKEDDAAQFAKADGDPPAEPENFLDRLAKADPATRAQMILSPNR